MKKYIATTLFLFIVLTGKIYSQSNLTWAFLEKFEKGQVKTTLQFKTKLSGFKNIQEANSEVKSCIITNSDNAGNCDLLLIMKTPHNKKYYLTYAQKMGVIDVIYNEEKISVLEALKTSH
jgi:hypothetical protein